MYGLAALEKDSCMSGAIPIQLDLSCKSKPFNANSYYICRMSIYHNYEIFVVKIFRGAGQPSKLNIQISRGTLVPLK